MQTFKQLPIDQLSRGEYQPRVYFNESELQELVASIRTTGVLQPILVRKAASGLGYEIIAGERRWRAAQLAGLHEVPCIVTDCDDLAAAKASIIENVQRANLSPLEEARAYQRMIEDFDLEHHELGELVGKSRQKISNQLRLLKLDARIQEMLLRGDLSEGHAKSLGAAHPRHHYWLAQQCVSQQWSVRRLESEIKKLVSQKTNIDLVARPTVDVSTQQLENNLSEYLGNRVQIHTAAEGHGKLEIRFNSLDELEGLLQKMGFVAAEA